MLALGLFRSGTAGPLASTISIATPRHSPRLQGLRCIATNNMYSRRADVCKQTIKEVMQDPNLDADQKFLIPRRLFAMMDYHTASSDCYEHWKKQCKPAEESVERLRRTDMAGPALELYKESMQMYLPMNKYETGLHLRAWRLYVFAPWSDAYLTLGQRMFVFVRFVFTEGFYEPVRRMITRSILLSIYAEKYVDEHRERP
jgi:hypothetical protein